MKELNRGGNNHPNADQQDGGSLPLCRVIQFLEKHQQIKIRITVDYCTNQETKLGGIDLYYPNADGRFQVGKRDPKLHHRS